MTVEIVRKDSASVTACFGDSITAGRPGVSYTRYLRNGQFRNFGLGGDTLTGLSKRVKDSLEKGRWGRYILQIGANDILLPFLLKYSDRWNAVVRRLLERGSVPAAEAGLFEREYAELLRILSGHEIIVVGIPCLGENLRGELNGKADKYNISIRRLCREFSVPFVDFKDRQREAIGCRPAASDYFFHRDNRMMSLDSLWTAFGLSAYLSRRRGLAVTVDGVHLNDIGAKALAGLIDNTLKGDQHELRPYDH